MTFFPNPLPKTLTAKKANLILSRHRRDILQIFGLPEFGTPLLPRPTIRLPSESHFYEGLERCDRLHEHPKRENRLFNYFRNLFSFVYACVTVIERILGQKIDDRNERELKVLVLPLSNVKVKIFRRAYEIFSSHEVPFLVYTDIVSRTDGLESLTAKFKWHDPFLVEEYAYQDDPIAQPENNMTFYDLAALAAVAHMQRAAGIPPSDRGTYKVLFDAYILWTNLRTGMGHVPQ
jgi:hypothetical protein